MTLVYKICPASVWREAEKSGRYGGSPVDNADGYIHLSGADQVVETAARHFGGQSDLLLVEIEADSLGDALRWEPSRGGALFPHLYGDLPVAAAARVEPLFLGPDGAHLFPERLSGRRPGAGPTGTPFDPGAAGWTRLEGFEFMRLVGPFWARTEAGVVRYGFVAEARHLNRSGVVHGGMVMTFIDQALGKTATAVSAGRSRVTVQLDTHFAGPIRQGDFAEAHCRAVRQTQSLLFMTGDVTVEGRIVAHASGIWKLARHPRPSRTPLPPEGGG